MKALRLAVVVALVAALAAASARAARAQGLRPEDRVAITEAVTGVGLYSDLRNWQRVEGFLADRVTTDYVSVFGGEVATAERSALVGQWRGVLPGFDATQHLIANVSVEGAGDHATARSHVRATHWIGDRVWTVGGIYTHRLTRTPQGWRITFMGIQRLYEEGDRAVLRAAGERAAAARSR